MKKKQLYLFYLIVTLITWSCADDLPDNGDVDDDGNDIEFNWNDAANLSSSTLTSSSGTVEDNTSTQIMLVTQPFNIGLTHML